MCNMLLLLLLLLVLMLLLLLLLLWLLPPLHFIAFVPHGMYLAQNANTEQQHLPCQQPFDMVPLFSSNKIEEHSVRIQSC